MSVDGRSPVTAIDRGDGTYVASDITTGSPPFSVAITLNGTPIKDSPLSVR
jgi:hypothetical protein